MIGLRGWRGAATQYPPVVDPDQDQHRNGGRPPTLARTPFPFPAVYPAPLCTTALPAPTHRIHC